MEKYIVNWVIFGLIFWTTAFLIIRRLFPKRPHDFCSRIVSTIHATIAVFMASLSVQDWTSPVSPLASESSPAQMKTLALSLSYMIYDLGCTIFGDNFTVDNAIHHIVSIIGLSSGLLYQKSGSEEIACLWVTEISTPFLHTREIIKEIGIRDTDLNLLVDVLFAVIFSFARMICGPYITYVTVKGDNPFLIKAMAMGIQLVSTFWFFKILRMIRYKLGRRIAPNKTTKTN